MNNEISHTIEVLSERVRAKEDEASKLKKLINELCQEAGLPVRYTNVADSSSSILSTRSDEYYGLPITTAIRTYLDKRKLANQGPASVSEIYEAIKEGGYKFDTSNEENAKVTIRNNLRKSSSIFHKLPNGDYGLLAWYPSAKSPKSDAVVEQKFFRKPRLKSANSKPTDHVTHGDVKEIINSITGEFQASDVTRLIKERFPSKTIKPTTVPTVLFFMNKKEGKIKVVSPRHGAKGAKYSKV